MPDPTTAPQEADGIKLEAPSRLDELTDFELPSIRALQVGWVALVIYALGFVVTSMHTARFGVPTYEFLRVRYAAAGVLFLFFLAAPVGTGLLFWREWRSIKGQGTAGFRFAMSALVTFVIGSFFWRLVPPLVTLDPYAPIPNGGLWFIGVAVATSVALLLYRDQVLLPPRRASMRHLMRLVFAAGVLALTVRHFTLAFFPLITPGLGGGGAVVAQLIPSSSLPRGLAPAFQGRVLIFDRTADAIRLVTDSTGTRRFEVPYDQIAGLEVFGEATMPVTTVWSASR